ncbi:DMT family transporter [Pseudonocardia alaniniphila]|uniref:DMT family transporter n=1 Tax=Pseudonocardia alaniniphila TaxID=75291 RepID=A0ABS9TES4_9PSEU|nr:DMT family transporter [Pseudonocardia alaniniphila]MCH6166806.1 DMT family transporter [Pseudonocardia alaniniphila]
MTQQAPTRVAPPVPASRYRWGALAAVVVTVCAWASAFVAIRAVGQSYGAGSLALGRLLVGCLALGAGLLVSRRWVTPTAREWGLIALCGVAWFGVYNVALNAAEQQVDAGTAAMVVNVGPILIALFAGWLLGEGFPRWLVVGALIAFGGAVLVGASTAQLDRSDLLGVVLCLVAAVTYAVGVLSQKSALRRLPALQVTWLACTIGAVACLPFTPALFADVAAAPAGATAGLVYLGLVPTALAFSTWGYALARMDAGRLGVTTYVVPPITIVMSAVLLGELPAALALVGGAICLIGVALSRRR